MFMNRLDRWDLFNPFSNEVVSAKTYRDGTSSTRTRETNDRRWIPAVDVCEDEHKFTIYADLPGMESDQINIQTANDVLSIRGERTLPSPSAKETCRRQERFQGRFERKFTLPETADTDKIEAHFAQGVLRVSIPKAKKPQARKITIQRQ